MSLNMVLERVLQPLGASLGIAQGSEWHGTLAQKYIDLREDSKPTDEAKADSDNIMLNTRTYIATRAYIQHDSTTDLFT